MQENLTEKRYAMSSGLSAHERIGLLAFWGLLVICWLCAAGAMQSALRSIVADFVELASYASLTFLFVAIVRLVFAKDLRKTVWTVSATSLVKKSPIRFVSVDFSHIVKFRYLRFPLMPGLGVITHNSGKLLLSFYIKDLAGLIAAIRAGLDASHNVGAYNAANLTQYILAAQAANARNERLQRFAPILFWSQNGILSVCLITSRYVWQFPLVLTFLWSLLVLVFFLCAIIGAENVLSVFSIKESSVGNSLHETYAYLLSGIVGLIACLSCGILFKAAVHP